MILMAGPFAQPVGAHADIVSVSPGAGEVLEQSPAAVRIRFTEGIDMKQGGVTLYDGAWDRVPVGALQPAGKPVQFGGATGSPYALTFLAHYCPHCQNEVPRMVALGQGGQIAGVDVIGIPTGTTDEAPNYPPSAWLTREDWDFPVALDDDASTAAEAYGLPAYPYFVFVDASGEVVGRTTGEIPEKDLEAIFTALAAGKSLPLPNAGASSAR